MAFAPSKLLLTDLASEVDHVPSNYIRPECDRPNLSQVVLSDSSIPLVDLGGLHGPDRTEIIGRIGHACREYGFFQASWIPFR